MIEKKVLPFLVAWMAFSLPVQASENLFRATWDIGDDTFQVDIDNVKDSKLSTLVRDIKILCKDGCAKPLSYEEKTLDDPVYIMRPTDDGNRIIMVWTTGSAYKITVYEITGAIKKVFTAGTKEAPWISVTSSGSERLNLCSRGECKAYEWKGGGYVVAGNSQ